MKLEGELTHELMPVLERAMTGVVIFKLADRFTAGIPDLSVSWHHSSWVEVKADTEYGKITKMRGLQLYKAQSLEFTTLKSWIIIYLEDSKTHRKQTVIVLPSKVSRPQGSKVWVYSEHVLLVDGFNHDAVANFLKERLR